MSRLREGRERRADARAVGLEQRVRHRSLDRDLSQRPTGRLGRLLRPAERAGHQLSTAHFQAAYPAVAEAGLGAQGVYIGSDLHGGSFVYDPWLLYARGVLSIANTLVLGMPDFGKSSLTKSWLYRSRVFGRRCEIIDPKGEYSELVHALGGVVLRLEPGGSTRLNPLTQIGTPELREGLLQAVAQAMLGRPLHQAEAVGVVEALAAADESHPGEVCIGHVVEQLRDPAQRTIQALDMTREDAREQLREVALALMRLCQGPLRGMFDAPTSAGDELWDAPAISLDISHIAAGSASSDLALAITMVCATAFLDAHRVKRTLQAQQAGREGEKTIRVNDEAWRALPITGLGEYYQAAFKLGRQTGVQHWMVLHRLSDLDAAGDTGTRQQALAKGLLAETGTVIVYRQHPDEARRATPILGLSQTESERIAHYPQGVALWRIGGRSYEVRHARSQRERELTATDAAMAQRAEASAPGRHGATELEGPTA
jgi:type IV secretory pathway VirB4 component